MIIERITQDKKRFLDLLLIGDEQESMIDRYLDAGDMFVLRDAGVVRGACVVAPRDGESCELKNIAVYPDARRIGYGRALVECVFGYYKRQYRTIYVGTGEVPSILTFYRRLGFLPSHRVEDFFKNNYDHPIFEEGVLLRDMVYLKKEL